MAWILVPALVVLGLDLGIDSAGGRAWDLEKNYRPPAAVEVKVTAKQFNWEFTYAGPDGKLGTADDVTIENELHVPVGKVVRLSLNSEDVIHSLWVPNLRLKQDVVPGRAIPALVRGHQAGHLRDCVLRVVRLRSLLDARDGRRAERRRTTRSG